MMKLKAFLFTTLFVFSAYSVTNAADFTPVVGNDENFSFFQALADEMEAMLANLEKEEGLSSEEGTQESDLYQVIQGDNLYRIALNHDISLMSLISWNNLEGEVIHPGDQLIVSGNEEEDGLGAIEPAPKIAVSSPAPSPPPSSDGKELLVTATAYTAYCEGCSGTTAYGIDLRSNPNQKVIAVDPKIIPLGTKVWVEGYGEAIAGDTGGAIKGHKIDVFIPSYDNAMQWGVKKVKMRVLN